MARPSTLQDGEDNIKRKAVRRLIAALALLAIAVAGLAVLDYFARQHREEGSTPPPKPPAPAPVVEPVPQSPDKPSGQEAPPPPQAGDGLDSGSLPSDLPAKDPEAAPPEDSSGPARRPARRRSAAADASSPPGPTPARPGLAGTAPVPEKPSERDHPSGPKGFIVQVGVFGSTANADALQAKLRQAGIEATTETRVQLGPFPDLPTAEAAVNRVRALGLKPVLVPQR